MKPMEQAPGWQRPRNIQPPERRRRAVEKASILVSAWASPGPPRRRRTLPPRTLGSPCVGGEGLRRVGGYTRPSLEVVAQNSHEIRRGKADPLEETEADIAAWTVQPRRRPDVCTVLRCSRAALQVLEMFEESTIVLA